MATHNIWYEGTADEHHDNNNNKEVCSLTVSRSGDFRRGDAETHLASGAVPIHAGGRVELEVLEPDMVGFDGVDGSSAFSGHVNSARTWGVRRVGSDSKGTVTFMFVELHGRRVGRGHCLGVGNQGDDLCHFEWQANESKSESTRANAKLTPHPGRLVE